MEMVASRQAEGASARQGLRRGSGFKEKRDVNDMNCRYRETDRERNR